MLSLMSISISCKVTRQRKDISLKDLPDNLKIRSLFVYFLQTYLFVKLKQICKENRKMKILKTLLGLIDLTNFGFKISYLFNKDSKFFNLYYFLMQSTTVYANSSGNQQNQWLSSIVSSYWIFILYFLFKVFEWRFNRATQLDEQIIDTEQEDLSSPNLDHNTISYKNCCGLCEQVIKNHGVVRTSNLAYCFNCLSEYVIKHKRCPSSGLPIEVQDVKKLYTD